MSASLIGRSGSSAFRLSTTLVSMSLRGSRFSSESAPGPSSMGLEDEAEQSFGRPCRARLPSANASTYLSGLRNFVAFVQRERHYQSRRIERGLRRIYSERNPNVCHF